MVNPKFLAYPASSAVESFTAMGKDGRKNKC